jgi:hypothetical protein
MCIVYENMAQDWLSGEDVHITDGIIINRKFIAKYFEPLYVNK